jgi:hypothetical protein
MDRINERFEGSKLPATVENRGLLAGVSLRTAESSSVPPRAGR